MDESSCACEKFDRLEGAATAAYISQFLDKGETDETAGKTYYYCRHCRRPWVRLVDEGNRKPSLVRLETDATA